MVSAVQGVLFTCDVPLKEYIRSLDEASPGPDKFIIAELDDHNLFVKVARAQFVESKVKEFVNSLHFTKPEARAAAYNELETAFHYFLKTRAEGPWRHAMGVATAQFQGLSASVRRLIPAFGAHASLLSRLQDLERDKLRLTLALYALKMPARLELFSWQREGGSEIGDGCGCGQGTHSHDHSREPTEAEHNAALKELSVALQDNVVAINDILDEVREMEEEEEKEEEVACV